MEVIKKKYILIAVSTLLFIAAIGAGWYQTASTTKIALLNFQPFQVSNIALSNSDKMVRYKVVSVEEIEKLKRYDFVLGFGMGLKLSEAQRFEIQTMMDKGKPVYIYAATTPENNICNLDSVNLSQIAAYLERGSKVNYQNLARYIRKNIDKKVFFTKQPQAPIENVTEALFHVDENLAFETVSDYEAYIRKHNFYHEGGEKVVVFTGIHDPFSGNKEHLDSLIVSLQRSGLNVYPITSKQKRIDFLEKIQPAAVIYFPHGRLLSGQPDDAVNWLKKRNIPIFTPLSILQLKEDWMQDPMGMFGGFMGQTIVMPELDGAIYPYVLVAQEKYSDKLFVFRTIPDRLKSFTTIVNNFINLKHKKNADKRVAIYYFKGAGQETLAAQGLETVPSLYNFLKRLRAEGYRVDNLPATEKAFEQLLMTQGAVLNTYAEGAFDDFLKKGNPELVNTQDYEAWVDKSLSKELYQAVTDEYGTAPGAYMSVSKNDTSYLAVARIQLGNIVLLPQPMAALGDDDFAIVHGAKMPPPHTYIGSYLWTQYGFNADVLIHFGTHGSLEFTPQKQVALSNNDWGDRLVGTIPHFYYYTIGNVGESMMAKRRSYATTISYLTPAFMESNTRGQFKDLQHAIRSYYSKLYGISPQDDDVTEASIYVKKITVKMGIHRELRLDSILTTPYTAEEIERIDNFAEEIANEKMNGTLYISGEAYTPEKIRSTVLAMSADPIAFSLSSLDKLKGRVTEQELKSKAFFTQRYLDPAKTLVQQVLSGKTVNDELTSTLADISIAELNASKIILNPPQRSVVRGAIHDTSKASEYTKARIEEARVIGELERTLSNITLYKNALEDSPELEFAAMLNAMAGGYVAPSSGGDAVANPNAVPTGHNLYAVNAESTPSEAAWERGVALVHTTLEQYKKQHGTYPRKVSYTFWSSEFVESEGTTIAQVLYMLGVEPVRDTFGRVAELRLIPSEVLGRPRIDVVVQTSGQFRDLAASRLLLISKAVEMAAAAKDEQHENLVSQSTVDIERQLVEQGISPKDARELSTRRIFGGINGMYGTGIQEMITSSDTWETEEEIADTYMHNMGAVYGSDKSWGEFQAGFLRTVLHHTDVIVQPRQNNTWGALSLDHVYEFMGGMNLAIRHVTGKDPEAYFADYRNRNHAKMQELKEAIGVESRSTVLNPAYIKEVMKGGAGSAAQITEVVTNTFGWNVAKPDVIDNELWDDLYDVYVQDKFDLGTEAFFRATNPAALQEVTAIMMESARKGMWQASDLQLAELAKLHIDLVKEFGSTGSGFAGGNIKLQDFVAQNINPADAQMYKKQLQSMKATAIDTHTDPSGMVLKKEQIGEILQGEKNVLNGVLVAAVVLGAFVIMLFILRKKRKQTH